jgi:hypothetical protein
MAAGARRTRGGVAVGISAMLGVIADPGEQREVQEFFELFKTPWEFYRADRQYDVILCAGDRPVGATAKVVLLYAGSKLQADDRQRIRTARKGEHSSILSWHGNRIPIYGDAITFQGRGNVLLIQEDSNECAAYLEDSPDGMLARIGYDLFGEIRALLTAGQPTANAHLPAVDLHIAFLRNLITGCGVPLVEIPPVPQGYQFVACLTHDVDHPSLRQHKLDYTIAGFLLRASVGSLIEAFLGRISIRDAARNWLAIIKLPLVHMGLAKDFWHDFDDRYLKLEKDLPSTFFLIPRKNYAGKRVGGLAPALRAARYEAKELADTILRLRAAGREIGLHGIDAWLDSSEGSEELQEIRGLTGVAEIGVRMHWLYFNEQSPMALEKADATYDSTIGYNETVGYRVGTTQVYKPLEAERLLELPMHAMDTALFYLSYLGLSPRKASTRLRQLTDNVVQFGGCFTVNWHDRSLAPERLWGGCYGELIQDMKSRRAWFATGGQAVSWFRKRRSAAFVTDSREPNALRVEVAHDQGSGLPGLRLRTHKALERCDVGTQHADRYSDIAVEEGDNDNTRVASEVER